MSIAAKTKMAIREERLHRIAEGTNNALRPANSSAASFPGRNECPGTHCSLIESGTNVSSNFFHVWEKF